MEWQPCHSPVRISLLVYSQLENYRIKLDLWMCYVFGMYHKWRNPNMDNFWPLSIALSYPLWHTYALDRLISSHKKPYTPLRFCVTSFIIVKLMEHSNKHHLHLSIVYSLFTWDIKLKPKDFYTSITHKPNIWLRIQKLVQIL